MRRERSAYQTPCTNNAGSLSPMKKCPFLTLAAARGSLAAVLLSWLSMDSSIRFPSIKAAEKRIDYRHYAMVHAGDIKHGAELFANDQLACWTCHDLDKHTDKPGPNLLGIGDKMGRGDIIDAILQPSANIADGFNTTVVDLNNGDEYTGILSAANQDWIELKRPRLEPVRISMEDVTSQRTSDLSLMPEGLHLSISPQDLADLVDYLVSLKLPESATRYKQGTPDHIQAIETPIGFIPFHSTEHTFTKPAWMGQIPGEPDQFLIIEHASSRIWRLEKGLDGDHKHLFLDLGPKLSQGGARGLMGLAFHPQFRENGRYFLALHYNDSDQHIAMTVERKATPDLNKDSGAPSRTLLRWNATTSSHTGGGLEFGPEGYLYVGMGDTGPHEDPNGHAQNMSLLKGKMLRIDIDQTDSGLPYAIPPDNPFVNQADIRSEIWASGLREPWRFSFDRATGELWVGDVGQDRYEEITILRRGENHGWNVWEGFERFSNTYQREGAICVEPIFAYPRKQGISVIGGYVYRKPDVSSFEGVYIFGDHQSRRIWGLTQKNRRLIQVLELGVCPEKPVSIAQSETGDLFVVGYEGTLFRLDFSKSKFEVLR